VSCIYNNLCRGSLRPENYFKGSSVVKRLRKAGLEKCYKTAATVCDLQLAGHLHKWRVPYFQIENLTIPRKCILRLENGGEERAEISLSIYRICTQMDTNEGQNSVSQESSIFIQVNVATRYPSAQNIFVQSCLLGCTAV
jgi:hypothetical protein